MTVLLLTATGVLTLLVVGVAVLAVRLTRRVGQLEARLAASNDQEWLPAGLADDQQRSPDAPEPGATSTEYVITHLGEPVEQPEVEAVPVVAPGLFTDIVLRETVVQTASLFHGVRRALSSETRNRIRFEMRRELKRARKQRRVEQREAYREWQARQRDVA
jgi:hypothetical protein